MGAPVVMAVVTLVLALAPSTAGAHAELLESDPGAGKTVTEGVDSVSLTLLAFDPEEPVSIEVTDPSGAGEGAFTFRVKEAKGGGFALGIPAAIFLRPKSTRGRDR